MERREPREDFAHELPARRTKAEQLADFASALSLLKHRAGELGLYLTMQRLEPAVRMVGFEIAGDPDACYRHEAAADRAVAKAAKGGGGP
jgi:hypothetical protein